MDTDTDEQRAALAAILELGQLDIEAGRYRTLEEFLAEFDAGEDANRVA
jgi:hypothetical protein